MLAGQPTRRQRQEQRPEPDRARFLLRSTRPLTLTFVGEVCSTLRWREPDSNLALMPTDRMGPPPGASPPMRMIASWSGSNDPTAYKSVARRSVPNGELPSDPQHTGRQAPIRHRSYAKARLAVHRRSACSGVKALRNTSAARLRLGGKPPSYATVSVPRPLRGIVG